MILKTAPSAYRSDPKEMKRLSAFLKKIYARFLKIRGQPREVALGLALGLFVGMSPSMGLQTAVAVFLAALLKWNKISAAIGVWITNPLTAPFIYGFTYMTGAKLLGIRKAYNPPDELTTTTISKVLQKAPGILWALLLGGAVIGLPLAVVGYFFSYSAIQRYQEKIKLKVEVQKERLVRKSKKIRKKLKRKTKRKKRP